MELGLTGQRAVVVGAANGIGLTTAQTFAQEGAHVALLDIDERVGDLALSLHNEYGVDVFHSVANVTDYAALGEIASGVELELGPVDHVVYTVGIGSGKTGFPFWNVEPHEWSRVIDVCLLGAVNTAYAFKDPMLERRSGTFLFLASVAGQIGSQTDPPYSAAKAGLINFSQCAAKDLAPYGIRVNTLNPGMVETQLQHKIWSGLDESERPDFDTWFREKVQRMVPLGRGQSAQDIANMAVFLASERANNVTGQTINVDGGFVMHW